MADRTAAFVAEATGHIQLADIALAQEFNCTSLVRQAATLRPHLPAPGRVDALPAGVFRPLHPGTRAQDHRLAARIFCDRDPNHALAAVKAETESAAIRHVAAFGAEVRMHAVVECEHSGDLVAGDRPHRFARFADAASIDLLSVFGDVRENPLWIAREKAH